MSCAHWHVVKNGLDWSLRSLSEVPSRQVLDRDAGWHVRIVAYGSVGYDSVFRISPAIVEQFGQLQAHSFLPLTRCGCGTALVVIRTSFLYPTIRAPTGIESMSSSVSESVRKTNVDRRARQFVGTSVYINARPSVRQAADGGLRSTSDRCKFWEMSCVCSRMPWHSIISCFGTIAVCFHNWGAFYVRSYFLVN